ncbi:hypothetical protein chiPu_0028041, partial [Chiloscyllium punctatum]|nr:hypothetical protein [Chiloscyllium punctatum]
PGPHSSSTNPAGGLVGERAGWGGWGGLGSAFGLQLASRWPPPPAVTGFRQRQASGSVSPPPFWRQDGRLRSPSRGFDSDRPQAPFRGLQLASRWMPPPLTVTGFRQGQASGSILVSRWLPPARRHGVSTGTGLRLHSGVKMAASARRREGFDSDRPRAPFRGLRFGDKTAACARRREGFDRDRPRAPFRGLRVGVKMAANARRQVEASFRRRAQLRSGVGGATGPPHRPALRPAVSDDG